MLFFHRSEAFLDWQFCIVVSGVLLPGTSYSGSNFLSHGGIFREIKAMEDDFTLRVILS